MLVAAAGVKADLFIAHYPPSPMPSPPGEDFCNHACVGSDTELVTPVADFSKDAGTVSPSPWGEGRGEGGQ